MSTCPTAFQVPRTPSSKPLQGANKVAVWHTTESDQESARSIASSAPYPVHLWWNPRTGEIAQNFGPEHAAKGLKVHNNEGNPIIQIEVLGHAVEPFTDGPLLGLEVIMGWLDALGIPRVAPAGDPLAYPASYGAYNGQRGSWGKSGHYGHSQVPGNVHGDPGAISWAKLFHQLVVPTPEPLPIGDDMDLLFFVESGEGVWLFTFGSHRIPLTSGTVLEDFQRVVASRGGDTRIRTGWSQAAWDAHPVRTA